MYKICKAAPPSCCLSRIPYLRFHIPDSISQIPYLGFKDLCDEPIS